MTPEWFAWYNMHQRCYNREVKNCRNYGGRGIKVCAAWADYKTFRADLGKRPTNQHSLDRIDNDGHYEPHNCKWSTPEEQTKNRRENGRHFSQVNNTSGIVGVGYRSKVDRWEAYARVDYKQFRLYWGSDFFEACCRRKSWENVNAVR